MKTTDPTAIKIQTNVKKEKDPTLIRMSGTTAHKNMAFDVPYATQIDGNLWQGGVDNGLELPHFFKHLVNLAPWWHYMVKHELNSSLSVVMYDSLDQSAEQVDSLARWVLTCMKDGPVLVHCQAGLNRSSLVVSRVLWLTGKYKNGGEIVELLREKRSPACLCNQTFEDEVRSWK